MVSNVTLEGPMTAQQDYCFTVTVTWKPPVYRNIAPPMYLVKWSEVNGLNRFELGQLSAVRELTSCVLYHSLHILGQI